MRVAYTPVAGTPKAHQIPSGTPTYSSTGTPIVYPTASPTPTVTTTPSPPSPSLTAGQTLNVNRSLDSSNGQYKLIMQDDGNLVLYPTSSSPCTWRWQSNSAGNPGAVAVMLDNGNFVVNSSTGGLLWQSYTSGNLYASR